MDKLKCVEIWARPSHYKRHNRTPLEKRELNAAVAILSLDVSSRPPYGPRFSRYANAILSYFCTMPMYYANAINLCYGYGLRHKNTSEQRSLQLQQTPMRQH
ncbi:unnamed protein product [Colias eurytheme]|nr:unnamed protein product [Colias eurytheme]